ncbi:MAG: helix-turn-helix transcriptional regulator [Geminicoccaceae bacterium]
MADVLHSVRFDPHYLDVFQTKFGTLEHNPLNAPHMAAPIGQPFCYESYLDRSFLEKSDVFAEVFRPVKLVHWLPMTLARTGSWFAAVNFQRSASQNGFEPRHQRLVAAIGPHLQRATRIYLELSKIQEVKSAYEDAISTLGHGVILVERNGRIVFMNTLAERMVERGDGLTYRQGRLEAAHGAERVPLRQKIVEATGKAGNMASSASFRLSRRDGNTLACFLFPIGDGRRSSFTGRPAAMLLFRADAPADPRRTATLMRLYDLSSRQAELVNLLMAGNSLPNIAQQLGISPETARTHLRRVFAKTGVTSQLELVKTIASGPLS